MVHTNHLPFTQHIHYYRRRREAPYTLSPKATPDAKPSHAIGTATKANKGNMQIPPFFKNYLQYYNFKNPFFLMFIHNLSFYNYINHEPQYIPVNQ